MRFAVTVSEGEDSVETLFDSPRFASHPTETACRRSTRTPHDALSELPVLPELRALAEDGPVVDGRRTRITLPEEKR